MKAMTDYLLHLADNALILGHRNSEWTGHGPVLEQDIALSNISLDLIGQARNFYQLAANVMDDGSTEDTLAYLRNAEEFKNALLAEQPNGDWGKTIMRQFLFSAYQYPLYQQLRSADHKELAAIAEKSLKEVTYHLRWSSEWVIRLGQGTEESMLRMTNAINELWKYAEDLLSIPAYAKTFERQYTNIHYEWNSTVTEVLNEAGLEIPQINKMIKGGNEGIHTNHLEALLNEMQYMQRTYPGVEW
jgi:ring-1,2-phenylacetyl-CoA epoxidase subunit PaaC